MFKEITSSPSPAPEAQAVTDVLTEEAAEDGPITNVEAQGKHLE